MTLVDEDGLTAGVLGVLYRGVEDDLCFEDDVFTEEGGWTLSVLLVATMGGEKSFGSYT